MLAHSVKFFLALFIVLFALPLTAQALLHMTRDKPASWSEADWSSTGRLPQAHDHKPAMVRIFAARTGRWRGIFAVHTWIVVKDRGGDYQRFDVVAWGTPLRINNYAPDGRWFSNLPTTVFAADGAQAEALIGPIRAAVQAYPFAGHGQYRVWPGPNSNTFVACVLAQTPQIKTTLPPTAIGKDFPCQNETLAPTATRSGYKLNFGGYGGMTLGWIEGFEINILGAVAGIDVRRPALKLPGFGRLGLSALN